jgi:hypothetical protein
MSQIRRARYRKHRRQSRKTVEFCTAMSTKFSGQETELTVTTAASDTLTLSGTPAHAGPYTLRGAAPPELRDLSRFWISWDGGDAATIYGSRDDLMRVEGAYGVATWDLSPDILTASADAEQLTTLTSVDTVATLSTLGTCISLGTPVVVSAVTNAADTLTIVAHGYALNQGPFYVASDGALPTNLAATTPYWIKTVPTVDTFTLAASLGGALIDLADDGSGNITFIPVNVDVSLDSLEVTAHGLATGDGPFYVSTGTTLPTGLTATTYYWVNVLTANRFALATTLANAMDGVVVNLTGIGAGTQTVSRVAVDTTTNLLRSVAHGLTTGTLVRLTTDGALPTGVAVTTNYWIIADDADHYSFAASLADSGTATAINLTAVGSGTTTVSQCRIDTSLNTYAYPSVHGWITGDGPVQATTGTTLPTGVSATTDYWIIRVDDYTVKLAATEAHALAGTPVIDITAIGAGTQTLTRGDIDIADNNIRLTAHGMQTGDGPVTFTSSDTLPTGIELATDYYIIRVDANHFQIAESAVLADAGTEVNITGIGAGTHQLVRTLTVGIDLTADGIFAWLGEGVNPDAMTYTAAASADTVFVPA